SPRQVPAIGRVSKEPRRTVSAIAIVKRSDCQSELSTRPIVDTPALSNPPRDSSSRWCGGASSFEKEGMVSAPSTHGPEAHLDSRRSLLGRSGQRVALRKKNPAGGHSPAGFFLAARHETSSIFSFDVLLHAPAHLDQTAPDLLKKRNHPVDIRIARQLYLRLVGLCGRSIWRTGYR